MRLAFVNDQFIAEEKAVIGISDLAIRRGFGIFDFFRTVGLKPLFADEHLSRFYTSVEKISLDIPITKEELKEVCIDLVRKNNMPNSGLRIILTGGYSDDGYTLSRPNLIVTNEPVKLVDEVTRARGVKVLTHNYQREFPEVKTINYFTGVMLQNRANSVGAYDILYHDHGQVREFTRSNIFIVTVDGKLVTPKDKLLYGVSRRKVIDLAREKYVVEERPLTMDELFQAKEVFMTGTTKRVLPVVQVDEHIIGDGKAGKITMDIFNEFYKLEQLQI